MLKCSQCESMPSYRYTVTVQSPSGTPGADGQVDLTLDANWTTEGTIKVNFASKSGREFINAQKVTANQSHTLETPSTGFSRTIQPSWRLRYTDGDSVTHKYQITSVVDVDEMRKIVRIECTEVK